MEDTVVLRLASTANFPPQRSFVAVSVNERFKKWRQVVVKADTILYYIYIKDSNKTGELLLVYFIRGQGLLTRHWSCNVVSLPDVKCVPSRPEPVGLDFFKY